MLQKGGQGQYAVSGLLVRLGGVWPLQMLITSGICWMLGPEPGLQPTCLLLLVKTPCIMWFLIFSSCWCLVFLHNTAQATAW